MSWLEWAAAMAGIFLLQWVIGMVSDIRKEVRAVRATQLHFLRAETFDEFTRHDAHMKEIERIKGQGEDP